MKIKMQHFSLVCLKFTAGATGRHFPQGDWRVGYFVRRLNTFLDKGQDSLPGYFGRGDLDESENMVSDDGGRGGNRA
jgi:hypothetical protein